MPRQDAGGGIFISTGRGRAPCPAPGEWPGRIGRPCAE
ncbi:hypothetical protein [Polaromonas sp. CG9_12]|nr:hypothetical protein [Polaromonas sp. CG9_12]